MKDTQLPWDPDDDIHTYFTKLDKLEEELRDEYNIECPTSLKILQAVNEMYESNNFEEKEMMAWEDDDNQTWVHLQTYFGELWEKKQRYGGTTPKAAGFAESTANVIENSKSTLKTLQHITNAATADKQHIQ